MLLNTHMTRAQRWHTRENTSLHTRDIGCPSRFQDSDELRGVSVRGSLRVRFRHQPSHFEAGMVHLPLEMVVCCYFVLTWRIQQQLTSYLESRFTRG